MSNTSDQGHEEFGSEDWFRTSDDVRQGVISGNSFDYKPVTYSVIDGKAIFEGDIVIAPVENLEKDVESIGENRCSVFCLAAVLESPGIVSAGLDASFPSRSRTPSGSSSWTR